MQQSEDMKLVHEKYYKGQRFDHKNDRLVRDLVKLQELNARLLDKRI